jgi:cell fate regulator YaaT (PSP1 superfamily)
MTNTAIVRYGAMDTTDRFTSEEPVVQDGGEVIVRTKRGVEWGRLAHICPRDEPASPGLAGELLRRSTPADREKHREIVDRKQIEEFRRCRDLIRQHELPMKLVTVEHLFGGNKVIFYFLAEGRVDFRQLVRDLAKEYRTRIEMRQIGVRDEARLMGLLGPCGHEICCRRFLATLKPVPMKLAKDQKSTLDPAKISGTCGRLKCCLKYEEELYRELKENLPRRGAQVGTPDGNGRVTGYEIIAQTVGVMLTSGKFTRVAVADISEPQPVEEAPADAGKPKSEGRPRGRGRGGDRGREKSRPKPKPQKEAAEAAPSAAEGEGGPPDSQAPAAEGERPKGKGRGRNRRRNKRKRPSGERQATDGERQSESRNVGKSEGIQPPPTDKRSLSKDGA